MNKLENTVFGRQTFSKLEAIGNPECRDIRNLASLTATGSVSSGCNPSTSGSSTIAAELGRRFPTFNARGGRTNSRKRSSSASNHETSSRSHSSKFGRPVKSIVNKDSVIIPNPSTNQVPSHASKAKLEERGLIIHEFPFDRRWTPLDFKRNNESQLPWKLAFKVPFEVKRCPRSVERKLVNNEASLL